jgi:hypothetical protein
VSRPADGASRDRSIRTVRVVSWAAAIGAAGLAAALSVVSAHAFKGHDGRAHARAPIARARPFHRVRVQGPEHVPAIAGAPAPLLPPQAAPVAVPPPVEQAPVQTSGAS